MEAGSEVVTVPLIEVLRSGVNTWECDQMGHMNVRHYFARASHGLSMLSLELGLPPSMLRAQGLVLRAREQHVRFIREMRPGTYYTLLAGVLKASAERLVVYEELRFVGKPEVSASMRSEVTLFDTNALQNVPFPAQVLQRAAALIVQVPESTAPRGIERHTPRTPPLRQEAIALGLIGAYLAPVQPEDCDASGMMAESAFMARISDGIGHFFQGMRGDRLANVGGAALEYRYVFHERPRLGDLIEVRSGLQGLGRKTTHFCHWVFNVETGRCAATSEAVAVSFDLSTRKSIEIPDEARAHMQTRIIPGLSI